MLKTLATPVQPTLILFSFKFILDVNPYLIPSHALLTIICFSLSEWGYCCCCQLDYRSLSPKALPPSHMTSIIDSQSTMTTTSQPTRTTIFSSASRGDEQLLDTLLGLLLALPVLSRPQCSQCALSFDNFHINLNLTRLSVPNSYPVSLLVFA